MSSRAAARTDEELARTTLSDLIRQRDAVLADLKRLRGQLESLLSSPTARPIPAAPEGARGAERRDPGTGPSRIGPPTGPERKGGRVDRPAAGAPLKPAGNAGTPGSPGTPGTGTPAKPQASPSVNLFQKPADHRRREVPPQTLDKTATPTSTGERTVVGREPGAKNGPGGATRPQPDGEARATPPAEATVKVDAVRPQEGRDAGGTSKAGSPGDDASTGGSDRKPETVQSASPSHLQ